MGLGGDNLQQQGQEFKKRQQELQQGQLQYSQKQHKKQTVTQADSQANETSPGDSLKCLEERMFLKHCSCFVRRKWGSKM